MNVAEKKIADFLDSAGIKYIYENPQLIEHDIKGKKFLRIYYPDFFLSEYGVILEFWGMHEDKEYAKVMDKKKEVYYYNWIFVINVYNLEGTWQEYILKKLEEVTKHRTTVLSKSYAKFKKIAPEVIKAAQGPDPRKAERQKAREAQQEVDKDGKVVFKAPVKPIAKTTPTTRVPTSRPPARRTTNNTRSSNNRNNARQTNTRKTTPGSTTRSSGTSVNRAGTKPYVKKGTKPVVKSNTTKTPGKTPVKSVVKPTSVKLSDGKVATSEPKKKGFFKKLFSKE